MRVQKGESLVILDDLVLDVSKYASEHPGGTFLLTNNIGRDISKFFYGGYAMDGNSNDPKQGSNRKVHGVIPSMIVNDLAVGIYNEAKSSEVACKI